MANDTIYIAYRMRYDNDINIVIVSQSVFNYRKYRKISPIYIANISPIFRNDILLNCLNLYINTYNKLNK